MLNRCWGKKRVSAYHILVYLDVNMYLLYTKVNLEIQYVVP